MYRYILFSESLKSDFKNFHYKCMVDIKPTISFQCKGLFRLHEYFNGSIDTYIVTDGKFRKETHWDKNCGSVFQPLLNIMNPENYWDELTENFQSPQPPWQPIDFTKTNVVSSNGQFLGLLTNLDKNNLKIFVAGDSEMIVIDEKSGKIWRNVRIL